MWIAIGALALLPLFACLVIRLFFYQKWIYAKIEWHMAKGRFDRALPLLRRQLEHLRRTKGENHLDTAVAKYALGHIDYQHGRTEEGRRLVDQATGFFSTYTGPEDNAFAVYLLNLGVAQRAIDRRDQAVETLRRAANLQAKLHGDESEQAAQAWNNLGATLEESGRASEAISVYEQSLRIRIALHGDKAYQVAIVRLNMGEAYISLQQWALAERHIQQAIEVLQACPMQELGQAYDTYARLLEQQECLTRAEQMRINSLAALKHALGETSVEVAKQMDKYAALLERLERRTECDLFRQKAAAIRGALA